MHTSTLLAEIHLDYCKCLTDWYICWWSNNRMIKDLIISLCICLSLLSDPFHSSSFLTNISLVRYVFIAKKRDDDSQVRNFSYSPWKADISGVNWGYTLAESDSSLSTFHLLRPLLTLVLSRRILQARVIIHTLVSFASNLVSMMTL